MDSITNRYRERLVEGTLSEYLAQLPALLVVGPRAAGKSTTLSRRAATIVRLDREAEAAGFRADPDAALRGLEEPVLLDEWQNVPAVLGAVRRAVESDPRPGRYLVTGSVNAELENQVWPGTGRLTRLPMYPMTIREQLGRIRGPAFLDSLARGDRPSVAGDPPDLRDYVELALRSGFPQPALKLGGRPRDAWLESYISDLLTHDIGQLSADAARSRRRDPQRLRRFFEAYALNSAGVAEQKTLYEAARVNRLTGLAYEGLFQDLLVAESIPAWLPNRLKRLVKQEKRYLIDAALIAAALRLDATGVIRDGDVLGRVLDTFVAAQLRPELVVAEGRPRLHHLRTKQMRQEIDLVAELASREVIAIEVKASSAPGRADASHLAWLREELGSDFLAGVVLHTGPGVFELGDRLVAAPICSLWS